MPPFVFISLDFWDDLIGAPCGFIMWNCCRNGGIWAVLVKHGPLMEWCRTHTKQGGCLHCVTFLVWTIQWWSKRICCILSTSGLVVTLHHLGVGKHLPRWSCFRGERYKPNWIMHMICLMSGAKSTKRPLLPKHLKKGKFHMSTSHEPNSYVLVVAVGFLIFGDVEVK